MSGWLARWEENPGPSMGGMSGMDHGGMDGAMPDRMEQLPQGAHSNSSADVALRVTDSAPGNGATPTTEAYPHDTPPFW